MVSRRCPGGCQKFPVSDSAFGVGRVGGGGRVWGGQPPLSVD